MCEKMLIVDFKTIKRYIKEADTDTRKYALYGYMTCMVHNQLITMDEWRELKKMYKFDGHILSDIMIIQ